MVIIGKTVVAVAGTPGPLLGDGTRTTVTILYPPTNPVRDANSLGAFASDINQASQSPRKDFTVSRLQLGALNGNTKPVYWGAPGVTNGGSTTGVQTPNGTFFPAFGSGLTNSVNMGAFDVNADQNGEGLLWFAEMQ
jgi:hypothetical protein